MAVTPLRRTDDVAAEQPALDAQALGRVPALAMDLVRRGKVDQAAMAAAQDHGQHLFDLLQSRQQIEGTELYHHIARHWQVGAPDLAHDPPDAALCAGLDPVRCLRDGLMPWRKTGCATVIVTAYPDRFPHHLPGLQRQFGPVLMAVAPMQAIQAAILHLCGPDLARASETRVAAAESCRQLQASALRRPAAALAAMLLLCALLQPMLTLVAAFSLGLLAMFSANLMKLIAFLLMRRPPPAARNPAVVAHLPVVSVMVALYRESNIAARLAQRLGRLDYPRELLDILLVVEAEDHLTRNALNRSDLPGWMRVIVVPDGSVKTKPRALNYALDHCRGAIIGIYDAEDAPEPDQLRKIVHRFHQRGPEVACLQGQLDYYNARSNWLARCFTIEYAAWFRLFLPGIERMGLAIPLGGTTLFFRRKALEELGGWDAQNVTEDADLGIRLFRHGYRTELIDTTTFEEANCRSFPWVKQRSRWIKGYMMTWLTHMRDPMLLWRQLGARRFLGFQVQFLGSILQSLLAPLMWSLWLIPFGLPHPFHSAIGDSAFLVLYLAMMASAVLGFAFDVAGMRRTQHGLNPAWALTLHFYHPLATLAAYKALWELLTRPFYWDKTSHGHFDA